MRQHLGFAVLVVVLAAVCAASADFELPLYLKEWKGTGGVKYVSNGVPLLPGQAKQTDELHVIGPDGKEVPAQFRVLARWWRADDSIRWVLVDFIGQVEQTSQSVYKLVGRSKPAPRPATPMKVTETDEVFRIDTGAALFEVNRKNFNLLNKVQIDANADGQYTDDETVMTGDDQLGSVTQDPQGRKYYGSLGTRFVKIIDSGPVRVTLLAKGNHVSKEAGAFQPALYGYEVFLTFHAGQPYVNVDSILTNNFEKPIGEPHFKDWSMLTRVGEPTGGGWGFHVWTSAYAFVAGDMNTSALLYQDSVGTPMWKNLPGVEYDEGRSTDRPRNLSTFRGYKVWHVAGDKKTVVDEGDFARGCAQCGRSSLGAVICPKDFWQQFPSAIEYGNGGVLRYSMFPREYSTVHWLEDGSAKGQEFQLFFYIKNAQKQYTAMAGNFRPWPHVVMDSYLSRCFALPSPQDCAAAGAMADLGPYLITSRVPDADYDLPRKERRGFMDDYLKGNTYGWQPWGNRWEELAGHSPWNYEPILTGCRLFNYLLTRNPNWLEYGLRLQRQARDVRAYLIDDQDNLAVWWAPGGKYQQHCVFESYSRPIPKLDPHPYRRSVWPLPNQEHLCLDEVYELYLMTGDDRARRDMEMIAAHGAFTTTKMRNWTHPSRSEGWCMRVLMRYYDLTGDKRYEPLVRQAVDRMWSQINKAGTQGGTWYGGIMGRGAITAYLVTGDERARDVALGQADWERTYEVGTEGYPYHADAQPYNLKPDQRGPHSDWCNAYLTDVHAFAYQQTGNPEYRDAMEFAFKMLGPDTGGWLYFLPMADYMAYGPRPDKVAPAAVTDLKAAAAGGKVTLTWTAPGDDGAAGTATVYQIKVATKPILEFVPWPEKKDTHVAFWGGENVPDEPKPAKAGTKQSYTFADLPAGTYYFAIKARDECSNQAAISNVATIELK
jgi:hypothetical protein